MDKLRDEVIAKIEEEVHVQWTCTPFYLSHCPIRSCLPLCHLRCHMTITGNWLSSVGTSSIHVVFNMKRLVHVPVKYYTCTCACDTNKSSMVLVLIEVVSKYLKVHKHLALV